MTTEPIEIQHFSDVLCVWAYIGHRRVEELANTFGERIEIRTRYCPVFTDVAGKIAGKWQHKGGFDGYAAHVHEVAGQFPHIELHANTWHEARPTSSAGVHLLLKAVEVAAGSSETERPFLERDSTRTAWALREAFFAHGENIADCHVQRDVLDKLSLDYDRIMHANTVSDAAARLAIDYESSQSQGVAGSPTFVMNSGRQKLFGNVGYRLLEANVEEVLRERLPDEISWC